MNSVGLSVKDLFCAFCFIDFINYRGGRGRGRGREKGFFRNLFVSERACTRIHGGRAEGERPQAESPLTVEPRVWGSSHDPESVT